MFFELFDGWQDIFQYFFDSFWVFRMNIINCIEDVFCVEEVYDFFKVLVCECIDEFCGCCKQISMYKVFSKWFELFLRGVIIL